MCLVLLYFVMLCSVDIPGRPVLFLERKQRENRSPGREKVGGDWEELREGKLQSGGNI